MPNQSAAPRLLFLTQKPDAPSFRHRLQHLIPLLESRGWQCQIEQLPKRRYFRRIRERQDLLEGATVVVLAKVLLGLTEHQLLRRFARRVVVDVDDAVFVRRQRGLLDIVNPKWMGGTRFKHTCQAADLVLAGNSHLAGIAQRHCERVEVVHTPVDTTAYQPGNERSHSTICWIGRPENLRYLDSLRPAFKRLAKRFPELKLRIICSTFPQWSDLPIEPVTWSTDHESAALQQSAIGIAPLRDDRWTRGKCSFKLLQYMAASLPCVASPVGTNREFLVHGETGFLANSPNSWFEAIATLLASPEKSLEMGEAARKRAEALYARSVVAPRAADLIESVAG